MELEGAHASFAHKLKVVNHIATVSRPRVDVAPSCKRAFGMLLTFWDAIAGKDIHVSSGGVCGRS